MFKSAMPEAPVVHKNLEEIDDDEDQWSTVPAFLRRKK
jgi:hypothetical protein